MNSRVVLQIPLPPYLMCFLRKELEDSKEKISITAKSTLGTYLMGIVEDSYYPMPRILEGGYLECTIPARDRIGKSYDGRSKWLIISTDNLKRFHRLVHRLMMRELFGKLDLLVERGEAQRKGGKMTQEIEKFIAKYSGEEAVLSMDNIRKEYYRYRHKAESTVNTGT